MTPKKEFMLLFKYELNASYQPTEAEMTEQHQQWGAFIGNLAMQEKLVSTYQLGLAGNQILANKTVVDGLQTSEKQVIGGNMVLVASNLAEATRLAMDCPILAMGGTVEVREIVPM
ncbi:MAG: YciI family protein [Bernardetiaceae bacterium]|jgi:hypothetical protein|nr:YciI family protein [Bernardetiaceae bacterium]